jgi:arsenite-transporting ATPase
VVRTEELLQVSRDSDGFLLSLALPLARIEDLELARSGDDLVVTLGGHRRLLALPAALRRCTVAGARLVEARLVVRFEPDPMLWRTT